VPIRPQAACVGESRFVPRLRHRQSKTKTQARHCGIGESRVPIAARGRRPFPQSMLRRVASSFRKGTPWLERAARWVQTFKQRRWPQGRTGWSWCHGDRGAAHSDKVPIGSSRRSAWGIRLAKKSKRPPCVAKPGRLSCERHKGGIPHWSFSPPPTSLNYLRIELGLQKPLTPFITTGTRKTSGENI